MVLDGLGLDKDATLNYIKTNLPTYPQFEAWVLSQKGGALDCAAVKTLNDAIIGYNHDDALATWAVARWLLEQDEPVEL